MKHDRAASAALAAAAAARPSPPATGGCPVKHDGQAAKGKVYNVYSQEIDPTNQMPANPNNSALYSDQKFPLPRERVPSTIPKGGTDGTWKYPSPQMFFNALRRKGKGEDVNEEDAVSIVAVHNNMNERTWRQWVLLVGRVEWVVMVVNECSRASSSLSPLPPPPFLYTSSNRVAEWEKLHCDKCPDPKLVRFIGKPNDLTPKAWIKHRLLGGVRLVFLLVLFLCPRLTCAPRPQPIPTIIHHPSHPTAPHPTPPHPTQPAPFDRHDWTVDRCGKEVRYVIDYYYDGEKADGDELPGLHSAGAVRSITVDARPALDSLTAVADRAKLWASGREPAAVAKAEQERVAAAAKGEEEHHKTEHPEVTSNNEELASRDKAAAAVVERMGRGDEPMDVPRVFSFVQGRCGRVFEDLRAATAALGEAAEAGKEESALGALALQQQMATIKLRTCVGRLVGCRAESDAMVADPCEENMERLESCMTAFEARAAASSSSSSSS